MIMLQQLLFIMVKLFRSNFLILSLHQFLIQEQIIFFQYPLLIINYYLIKLLIISSDAIFLQFIIILITSMVLYSFIILFIRINIIIHVI